MIPHPPRPRRWRPGVAAGLLLALLAALWLSVRHVSPEATALALATGHSDSAVQVMSSGPVPTPAASPLTNDALQRVDAGRPEPPQRADANDSQPLQLVDVDGSIQTWEHATVLEAPFGPDDLPQVLQRRASFTTPTVPRSNFGSHPDPVWMRIPIEVSPSSDGRWIFELNYPPLSRADLYVVRDGSLMQRYRLGSSQPFQHRPMQSRAHAVELDLRPAARYELFVRLQTSTTLIAPISLHKPDRFLMRESVMQILQGMSLGAALILLCYTVAHGVVLRDPIFPLYAAILIGSNLFFIVFVGIGQQYLWHTASEGVLARAAPMSVLLALAACAMFVPLMLDTARDMPRLDRALRLCSIASALALLAALSGLLDYRYTQFAAIVLGPCIISLCLPAAWIRTRQRNAIGLCMLVGWSFYLLSALAMAALLRGRLPANDLTLNLFQVGMVLETLAWLCTLSLKVQAVSLQAQTALARSETLESLASTDPLTGLMNRRGLMAALQLALADPRHRRLGVFLLDLDGFKAVNDNHGHETGDALLVEVATALRETVRTDDLVARLGGDEFIVLGMNLHDEGEALALGSKLLTALTRQFTVREAVVRIGVTIGFALSDTDGDNATTLIRHADAAMYQGKQAGRNSLRRWRRTQSTAAASAGEAHAPGTPACQARTSDAPAREAHAPGAQSREPQARLAT